MFLLIGLLFISMNQASVFDGSWQLDLTRMVGSCDHVLELIGVSAMRRHIISGLSITERYTLTEKSIRIVKDTMYNHGDVTFEWNVEKKINDPVLGDVRQTMTMHSTYRIDTRAVRDDGGVYVGTRKPFNNNLNQIVYQTNYTTKTGKQASCSRYFKKIS
jgi:hypothetical protein